MVDALMLEKIDHLDNPLAAGGLKTGNETKARESIERVARGIIRHGEHLTIEIFHAVDHAAGIVREHDERLKNEAIQHRQGRQFFVSEYFGFEGSNPGHGCWPSMLGWRVNGWHRRFQGNDVASL